MLEVHLNADSRSMSPSRRFAMPVDAMLAELSDEVLRGV
jgi:hypothetical protein